MFILFLIIIFLIFILLYFYLKKNNIEKKEINIINLKEIDNCNEEKNNIEIEKKEINIISKKNYIKFNNINVDRTKIENNLCKFGDDGYIYPIRYYDNNIIILPYQECEDNIKDNVCECLYIEWKDEAKLDTLKDTNDYIDKNWVAGDIFYVLIKDNKLIGFVAVDRKQFYPFISHLYVTKENRNSGFGIFLIDFAEEYVKCLKFNEIRLWCIKDLVKYYEKNGWNILDDKDDNKIVMIKKIYKANL